MELAVGAIVEGKVTGITKFGAFVALPGNKTGMVHISEIAHAYVSDINEYLTIGQDVKVKIIAMDQGKINLFNAKYELDDRPIEEGCQCPACRRYSRAYIRHLLKAKEMLGMRLCVLHNLYFYNTMMTEIRDAIDRGEYQAYKKRKLDGLMNGQS